MLTAVLDTSVIAAAFLKPGGVNHRVLRKAGQDYRLVLSEAILQETERVLMTYKRIRTRYPYTDQDVKAFLGAVREVSQRVLTTVPAVHAVEEDPDDDIVLGCALAGKANHIVSKDHHLQALGAFEGIRIVSTEEFLRILHSGVERPAGPSAPGTAAPGSGLGF